MTEFHPWFMNPAVIVGPITLDLNPTPQNRRRWGARVVVHWPLPDKLQCVELSPDGLLYLIDTLGMDGGAKFLLLLWRTWYIRMNNLTHSTSKLAVEASAIFQKYWLELWSIRHQQPIFDQKGKGIVCCWN
jgi:hypothetical protein